MDIAIADERKYGNQRRYYVLKSSAVSDAFPSDNWREVKREDFVTESIAVYLERSK